MSDEIYVVVAENDQAMGLIKYKDESGELVFEQYTKDATLENAKQFIKRLDGNYGKCRIAKLEFIEL